MARFDRQIETALRLIKKNGKKVNWRKFNKTQDENEPWKISSALPSNFEVFICFLPITKENRQFVNYLRGSNEIKIGSVLGLMGNVSFNPSGADIVIDDGKELAILSIDLLAPNGQKILYTIEFK